MRFRIFALLIMGLVLATIAGFATFSYTRGVEVKLTEAEAAVKAFGDIAQVPVALTRFRAGDLLRQQDFGTLTVPARHVPPNLLMNLPDLAPEHQIMALTDLVPGALILEHQIGLATAPEFNFAVSADGRAIHVMPRNIDDYQSVLKPGMPVDLFWTRNIGGGSTETRLIGVSTQASSQSLKKQLFILSFIEI